MRYHLVDPDELRQWHDRPTDVRSLSVAAGYEYQNANLGMRVYEPAPGEQSGLNYSGSAAKAHPFTGGMKPTTVNTITAIRAVGCGTESEGRICTPPWQ
jgi:hypothetical protein